MVSDSLLHQFDLLASKYPVKRSALIPMLLATQEELGYLTPDSIRIISEYLKIPEIEVYEVITFYSMLRTKPVGRHLSKFAPTSRVYSWGEKGFSIISQRSSVSSRARSLRTDSSL